jgi:hypothetical protein
MVSALNFMQKEVNQTIGATADILRYAHAHIEHLIF